MKALWLRYGRTVKRILLVAALFFMLGFAKRYHVPRIKQWLLVEIEDQSRRKTPVRLWPQSVDFHLFPLGATFHQVRVLPQNNLATLLAPTQIEKVRLTLSAWGLLKGQLRLGEILVSDADLNLIIRKSEKSEWPKNLNLEILDQIPVDTLRLEKIRLAGLLEEQGFVFQTDNLALEIENKYQTLRATLLTRSLKLKNRGENSLLDADLAVRALLDEEGLYFSNLEVRRQDSFISGTGSLTGPVLKGEIRNLHAKMRGDWNLSQIATLLKEFFPKTKIPEFSGRLSLETDLELRNQNQYKATYLVNTQDLKIDRYEVGQLHLTGKADQSSIQISKSTIQNYFGQIQVNNFQWSHNAASDFKGEVLGDNLELHFLLKALGLPNIPVYNKMDGTLPCLGNLHPKFKLTCHGEIRGRELAVKINRANSSQEIVNIPNYKLNGSLTVDTQAVQYKTKIEVQKSTGESVGTISYKDGFLIKYETPGLDFAYIKNIVGLKPEGVFAIKGQTSGDSRSATMQMKAQGEKAWLYDYALGKVKFDLRYRKGILHFDKLAGQLGATQYQGNLQVNTKTDRLTVDGHFPFLDAEDIPYLFSRKIAIPLVATGTGSAKINVSGPLDPSRVNFDFDAALFRGSFYEETFDQLQAHIVGENGTVRTQKLFLNKGKSQLSAQGQITASKKMNLNLLGRNFLVEQSENLARLKINMTGNLNFDANFTGTLSAPNIEANGQLTRAAIDDQAVQDSLVSMKLTDKELIATGRFAGGVVTADLKHQLGSKGTTQIRSKATNWNFAQAFSIFSDQLRNGLYQTKMSGEFDFIFPNSNPDRVDGKMRIDEISLKNGRTQMQAKSPLIMTAEKGLIRTDNFEISGDNTYLRLKSLQTERSNLNLGLEGRLDMSLLTLLTPFLDDLRGIMSLSIQLNGPPLKPKIAGSVFVEDGFVKLKGFPHAFEQLTGDTILNNDRIIVNSVRGRMGGGVINASGQVHIKGLTDVLVDIRGQMNDVKLSVPEGFNTRGSGDFFVKGSWFPYTVGALYNIDSGSIEKRGLSQGKSTPEVKPSVYLPKFISVQRFSPIVLALDVNMRKQLPVKLQISRIDIRAEVDGHMKVNGPPEAPLLTGKVQIARGGKVTFRNNTFEIVSGQVEYQNTPPENPTLNVQAQAQVTAQLKNGESRNYDVDLRVLGPANDPKVTMYSEPALPETELLSLLTLGFITETATVEETETSAGDQLTNTSYQLGSAFLNEQLGINRALESRFGVQFDFNSSYDTSDKAEKHKFTLRKQWTPKFGTSASREIGKTSTSNVKAEYKLNKNLSVIGEWEGKEAVGAEETTDISQKNQNLFGLDIEYKVEFK